MTAEADVPVEVVEVATSWSSAHGRVEGVVVQDLAGKLASARGNRHRATSNDHHDVVRLRVA